MKRSAKRSISPKLSESEGSGSAPSDRRIVSPKSGRSGESASATWTPTSEIGSPKRKTIRSPHQFTSSGSSHLITGVASSGSHDSQDSLLLELLRVPGHPTPVESTTTPRVQAASSGSLDSQDSLLLELLRIPGDPAPVTTPRVQGVDEEALRRHCSEEAGRLRAEAQEEEVSNAMIEQSFYTLQLKCNAEKYPIKKHPKCQCNVTRHPWWWSEQLITNVHDYSFLLNLRGIVNITMDVVVASNEEETSVVCQVPMVEGDPFKKKAENVIRYTDVETGVGDMTVFDLLYYRQPLDRKIFVLVSGHRVEGLVVAEPLAEARRILTETPDGYRELEVEPTAVRVGINRIWVHVSRRREGWAALLCDVVRWSFYEGGMLEKADVAFNIGTDSGISFAKWYLKTRRVPLYPGITGSRTVAMAALPDHTYQENTSSE